MDAKHIAEASRPWSITPLDDALWIFNFPLVLSFSLKEETSTKDISLLFISCLFSSNYHLIWSHSTTWTSHYTYKYDLLYPATSVIAICDRNKTCCFMHYTTCCLCGSAGFCAKLIWKAFITMVSIQFDACSTSWLIKLLWGQWALVQVKCAVLSCCRWNRGYMK